MEIQSSPVRYHPIAVRLCSYILFVMAVVIPVPKLCAFDPKEPQNLLSQMNLSNNVNKILLPVINLKRSNLTKYKKFLNVIKNN